MKIGKTYYEVEWTTDVPVNEFGDCEPDAGIDHQEYFTSLDQARDRAREVYPDDYWGSVRITECWKVIRGDEVGEWAELDFGEVEYWDGDASPLVGDLS